MRRVSVVLVDPVIPGNTGGIGRTCLGLQSSLHVVNPGFDMSSSRVKRAGLDYWEYVDVSVHKSWNIFQTDILPTLGTPYYFTKYGTKSLFDVKLIDNDQEKPHKDICLIFGSETVGFTQALSKEYLESQKNLIYIPMESDKIRSFNLAVTTGIALFEAHRQIRYAKS